MPRPTLPVAAVRGLTKTFQAVTALRDVSIEFKAGSVHVLFGENGAGKSTLIGILSGVYQQDAGQLLLSGANADGGDLGLAEITPSNPREARELGISAVFQEPALVAQLSVAENLTLGRESTRNGLLQRRLQLIRAKEALARVGSTISPSTMARELSRADQQVVEIARALQDSARLLILDEPTASLTEDETSRLFDIVRRLRGEGIAIIYITHRMGEIRQIGDEVSVLRDGALVRTCALSEVTDDELVTLMIGRQVGALFPEIPHTPTGGGLELQGVDASGVHDVSIRVRRGEVVGLTGLVGSGKGDIGKICFGLAPVTGGRILIDGEDAGPSSPESRLRKGLIYYPADRKRDGLIGIRPARENVTLSSIGTWTSGWFINRRAERAAANAVLSRLSLRPANPEALPTTFSGGNQQKIVLARGFTCPYAIHVFDEPTAGVDVGARAEIYQAMSELAQSGAAVLVISSDLPEIVGLVHRAYVVAQGRIVGEFTGDDLTEETLLPAFFIEAEDGPSNPIEAHQRNENA
ncbi:MAG TPA: sugar ABC transporter ATP-binding protein [Homoserinimonas sp.]|nr:sugar ABC transporter ATP-binding protein [Homoserinimonas sp.]